MRWRAPQGFLRDVGAWAPGRLDVEAEVHDVAILHDIFLALDVEQAGIAHGGFGAQTDVVVVLDDLGADEAFLNVSMDRSMP